MCSQKLAENPPKIYLAKSLPESKFGWPNLSRRKISQPEFVTKKWFRGLLAGTRMSPFSGFYWS